MQKITTYDRAPQLKPIFRKPARVIAGIILTGLEMFEWVDNRLFMADEPWQMKLQYYGFLTFMFTIGFIFLALCM